MRTGLLQEGVRVRVGMSATKYLFNFSIVLVYIKDTVLIYRKVCSADSQC